MPRRGVRGLIACATLAAAALAAAQELPVRVGAVLSESGASAGASEAYRRGLELWQQEVNARGGILERRVELRTHDDQSDTARTGPLYERLLREERVDVLIGPHGSAASSIAAAVAERARRVMLNAGGASRSVHKAAHLYVFQIPSPYAGHADPVLELARAAGVSSLFVLARRDTASREAAQGLVEGARAAGLAAADAEQVAAGQADFTAAIGRARATNADAWVAFASAREAADLVRAFRKLDYAPRLLVAQGSAGAGFVAAVGQDAEFTMDLMAYDPGWNTNGNATFVAAYRQRWGGPPTADAAQSYSAGLVLEAAARRARTLEPAALRAALAELSVAIPLGQFRVDPRTGVQVGVRPALVQIQRGRPVVVWPAALATGRVQPYPGWNERTPIR